MVATNEFRLMEAIESRACNAITIKVMADESGPRAIVDIVGMGVVESVRCFFGSVVTTPIQ